MNLIIEVVVIDRLHCILTYSFPSRGRQVIIVEDISTSLKYGQKIIFTYVI